jgi:hypothetical protein
LEHQRSWRTIEQWYRGSPGDPPKGIIG